MVFLRKYNVLLVTGTTAIRIPIIKRAVVDYAVSADWTPAAGDVKIRSDAAAIANVTNLPTAVAIGNTAYWEFILTAAELSCKQAIITVSDSATKVVEDQTFLIETFGNASAMYPLDLTDGVRLGITALPNAAAEAAGGLYTRGTGAGQINQPANGQVDANAVKVGGTVQTGRDIGASVLLSSGTGTGQLDFTSGVVKANLVSILGTALTETAGQIAGAFKKFFDKATPTGTINSIPDAVAGASGGLPTTNGTKVLQTVDLTAGQTIAVSDKTGFSLTSGERTSIGTAVWAATTRELTAATNITAGISTAVWDYLTTSMGAIGSIGLKLRDWVVGTAQTGDAYAIVNNGTYGNANLKTVIDAGFTAGVKETTLNTKIPTALSFTGANVNAESKVTAAPADMALNSTVAKDATVAKAAALVTVQSDTDDIQSRLPAALVGGKMDSTATVTGNVTLAASQPNLASTGIALDSTVAKDVTVAKITTPMTLATDAITAAVISSGALDKLVKVSGTKRIINTAGTQVKIYDITGVLLVTLDRTGTGPYTWTPTWA